MLRSLLLIVATVLTFDYNGHAQNTGESFKLLTEVGTILLDGVEGRIDHFGLDAKRRRLFVAALGNDTVEVIDLATGRATQHIEKTQGTTGRRVLS